MAVHAVQLAPDDPQVLGPGRHVQAHEGLDGLAVAHGVQTGTDAAHPLHHLDHLVYVFYLAQLFQSAMHVAQRGQASGRSRPRPRASGGSVRAGPMLGTEGQYGAGHEPIPRWVVWATLYLQNGEVRTSAPGTGCRRSPGTSPSKHTPNWSRISFSTTGRRNRPRRCSARSGRAARQP